MGNNSHSPFFDFESLELYKKSLEFIDFVYNIIKGFPKEEQYGISSQFRNAANSFALNVGEGYGESILLALRYLRITRGSIRECLVCTEIVFRRKYILEEQYLESRIRLVELSKLSSGYGKYLKAKLNN